MNPKIFRSLNAFEKALRKDAVDHHLAMMSHLTVHHQAALGPEKTSLLGNALRDRDYLALLDLADEFVSAQHDTARSHFLLNQFALLIKKYPWPSIPGVNPEEAALEKFSASERSCAQINAGFSSGVIQAMWSEQLSRMRGYIDHVLETVEDSFGFPKVEHDRWIERCDFSAGASLGTHGDLTHVGRKIDGVWSLPAKAHDYAFAAVASHVHLREVLYPSKDGMFCFDNSRLREEFRERVTYSDVNKIAFVPKTTRVHRTIAVEPLLLNFVQKGIDLYMRDLLRVRAGVDLSDQGINSDLAREGSLDDTDEGFVTIDLSSASDSVSIGLVREVLPPHWFRLLDACRSSEYYSDSGLSGVYEKFCSMGNGFCFPLETLLFLAACHAVGCRPGEFRCYGDDIIVQKARAPELIAFLQVIGFATNKDKTFLEGPFRESCGADWYLGENVRPYTLDERFDTIESIFKFLNSTTEGHRSWFFAPIRDDLIEFVPAQLRFTSPYKGTPIDAAIWVEPDVHMSSPSAFWCQRHQGWNGMILSHVACHDSGKYSREAVVYAALRGSPSEGTFTFRRKSRDRKSVV